MGQEVMEEGKFYMYINRYNLMMKYYFLYYYFVFLHSFCCVLICCFNLFPISWQVIIFVDNSGADIILGILPFARELLRHGSQVC